MGKFKKTGNENILLFLNNNEDYYSIIIYQINRTILCLYPTNNCMRLIPFRQEFSIRL